MYLFTADEGWKEIDAPLALSPNIIQTFQGQGVSLSQLRAQHSTTHSHPAYHPLTDHPHPIIHHRTGRMKLRTFCAQISSRMYCWKCERDICPLTLGPNIMPIRWRKIVFAPFYKGREDFLVDFCGQMCQKIVSPPPGLLWMSSCIFSKLIAQYELQNCLHRYSAKPEIVELFFKHS